MKIRPVGAELFHVDRWTNNMSKLIVVLRNFSNPPKKINEDVIANYYGIPSSCSVGTGPYAASRPWITYPVFLIVIYRCSPFYLYFPVSLNS